MHSIDRRTILRSGLLLAGGAALTACGADKRPVGFVSPTGEQVRAAEAARRAASAAVRDFRFTALEGPVDLGGPAVRTWTYDGRLPGKEIRVKAGEVVRARLSNRLPADTSVHWHGLRLRNDADGVPDITQPSAKAGADAVFEFTAPDPGTYWFHPHTGGQLDRGLYAPLIVEDPHEPLSYDKEWTVILDDWLDGVTGNPDDVLAELRRGMGGMGSGGGHGAGHSGHGGMDMGGQAPAATPSASPSVGTTGHMLMGAFSDLLGGDAGDVRYPYFLINGRIADSPETFRAKAGERIRIRFINAGADTAFRVALGGHRMTVTHSDGFPLQQIDTDALLIGMGERYDVLVTAGSGAFPLTAVAEGKASAALAVLRTSDSAAAPRRTDRPAELDRKIVSYAELRPTDAVRLPAKRPARTILLNITGGMMRYDWAFNGRPFDPKRILGVRSGERVRLQMVNRTTMWHPMHVHGHTFALTSTGLRKDTVIVLPGKTVDVDFDADNPGRWMIHCHNIYHAESGMMALLGYQS